MFPQPHINPFSSSLLKYLALYALAFLLFYPFAFWVGHDLSSYIEVAKNFIDGRGMVHLDETPSSHRFGYKFLLALALKLGGENHGIFHVMLMQVSLNAGLAITLFAFTNRFFDQRTALLSYLFLVLCPSITGNLPLFAIDGVWPLFSLLSLLLFTKTYDGDRKNLTWLYVFGAGCLAGMNIWIKEATSLNFLIVPLLLCLFSCVDRQKIRLLLFYLGCIVTALLGQLTVSLIIEAGLGQDSLSETQSFSSAAHVMTTFFGDSAIISSLIFFLNGLKAYFTTAPHYEGAYHYFPAMFLIFFAVPYTIYLALLKRHQGAKVTLSILLAYALYMAWAAQWTMRFTQLLLIFMCFSVMISAFLWQLYDRFIAIGGNIKALPSKYTTPAFKLMGMCFILAVLGYHHWVSYLKLYPPLSPFKEEHLETYPLIDNLEILLGKRQTTIIHEGQKLSAFFEERANHERHITILTSDIMAANGLSYYLSKERFTVSLALYSKIMLGVHENPYSPYFNPKADQPDFLCMHYPHSAWIKKYTKIYSFDARTIHKFHNQDTDIYILSKRGHICGTYLYEWVRAHQNEIGYQLTEINDFVAQNEYRAFKVTFKAAETAATKTAPAQLSLGVRQYINHLKINDPKAYAWHIKHYPFFEKN